MLSAGCCPGARTYPERSSSTLVSNTASGGGGGGNLYNGGGSAWLHDSLLAFGAPVNCTGTITSTGHRLESANNCGLGGTGDWHNTGPGIGPLADNGGLPYDGAPPQTHALLAGSAAIIAADPANCPATDERAAAGAWDIGAFEFGVKVSQIIDFTIPAGLLTTQSPYGLLGTASSGLAVTYTVSGAPCGLAGANLLRNSSGPCGVTARQAGDGAYSAAPDITRPITAEVPRFLPLVQR